MRYFKLFIFGCGSLFLNHLALAQMKMPAGGSQQMMGYDTVSVQFISAGLTAPLSLMEAPDNSGRLFVVDQPGKIFVIKNGKMLEQPFLSITKKIAKLSTSEEEEKGLLGLAFHPDFKNNGKFYVYYSAPLRSSAPKGWSHTNRVAEYRVSPNSDVAGSA